MQIDYRGGDTLIFNPADQPKAATDFGQYFRQVHQWSWSIYNLHPSSGFAELITRVDKHDLETNYKIDSVVTPIASDRQGRHSACEIEVYANFKVGNDSRQPIQRRVVGSIVFLPSIGTEPKERFIGLLETLYGVSIKAVAPLWAEDMQAPSQKAVDDELLLLNSEYEAVTNRIQLTLQRRDAVRLPLKVLYALDRELETCVLDLLFSLGGTVEEPTVVGEEDGWVTAMIDGVPLLGVMEIKSTAKAFVNEDALKQVSQWVDKGVREREVQPKGIIIANADALTDPKDRGSAFLDPLKRKATIAQRVLLDTKDLYEVYCRVEDGTLAPSQFWRALFETNGHLTMELIEAAKP